MDSLTICFFSYNLVGDMRFGQENPTSAVVDDHIDVEGNISNIFDINILLCSN